MFVSLNLIHSIFVFTLLGLLLAYRQYTISQFYIHSVFVLTGQSLCQLPKQLDCSISVSINFSIILFLVFCMYTLRSLVKFVENVSKEVKRIKISNVVFVVMVALR